MLRPNRKGSSSYGLLPLFFDFDFWYNDLRKMPRKHILHQRAVCLALHARHERLHDKPLLLRGRRIQPSSANTAVTSASTSSSDIIFGANS